jgi:hypothetical protein
MPTFAPSSQEHPELRQCPRCGRPGLARVPRRFVDHLLNLFVRVKRYRCSHVGCDWEGNLRAKRCRDGRVDS